MTGDTSYSPFILSSLLQSLCFFVGRLGLLLLHSKFPPSLRNADVVAEALRQETFSVQHQGLLATCFTLDEPFHRYQNPRMYEVCDFTEGPVGALSDKQTRGVATLAKGVAAIGMLASIPHPRGWQSSRFCLVDIVWQSGKHTALPCSADCVVHSRYGVYLSIRYTLECTTQYRRLARHF